MEAGACRRAHAAEVAHRHVARAELHRDSIGEAHRAHPAFRQLSTQCGTGVPCNYAPLWQPVASAELPRTMESCLE